MEKTILANLSPTDGRAVSASARNTSFQGAFSEPVDTNIEGDIIFYFYLLDYNSRHNQLVSVLELRPVADDDEEGMVQTGHAISWPKGRVLPPDTCDFEDCEAGGRSTLLGHCSVGFFFFGVDPKDIVKGSRYTSPVNYFGPVSLIKAT